DLRKCVQAFQNSTPSNQYALGLLFTDNDPKSENFTWDYLKIDHSDPSVPNAVSGAYRFVTVETWQYRKVAVNGTPVMNTSKLNYIKGLFLEFSRPGVLAVQNGFLALQDLKYKPGVDGNNVWPGSVQSGTSPHICTPPIFFNKN